MGWLRRLYFAGSLVALNAGAASVLLHSGESSLEERSAYLSPQAKAVCIGAADRTFIKETNQAAAELSKTSSLANPRLAALLNRFCGVMTMGGPVGPIDGQGPPGAASGSVLGGPVGPIDGQGPPGKSASLLSNSLCELSAAPAQADRRVFTLSKKGDRSHQTSIDFVFRERLKSSGYFLEQVRPGFGEAQVRCD